MVKSFWHADLGTKLFMAGALMAKLGLAGPILGAIGRKAAKRFAERFIPRMAAAGAAGGAAAAGTEGAAGGLMGATGKFGRAGRVMGKAFGKMFAVAAVLWIYSDLKNSGMLGQYSGKKGWGELWRDVKDWLPGKDSEQKRRESRLGQRLKDSERRNTPGARHPIGDRGPTGRRRKPKWSGDAQGIVLGHGGTIRTGGSAIVGDRGPEMLNLPRGARVDPLPSPGGGLFDAIAGRIDNNIRLFIGEREVAVGVDSQVRQKEAFA
jgi:hypothetical protein